MQILAIDPGTTESAWLVYDMEQQTAHEMGICDNEAIIGVLDMWEYEVVCEWVECMGMPVGRTTFETVYWIGKFSEHADPFHRITRREIKLHLCGNARAKDANVRQALLDRFPATGGGKTPQIGTKPKPGPLYGIRTHLWSALAVAVAYAELGGQGRVVGVKP